MDGLVLILRRYFLVILMALAVGIIGIYPQLRFINYLGDEYRGIPLVQSANEDAYLGIMQEIADGHWSAASVPFFEYKNLYPLLPPTAPAFYVLFSKILDISLVNILILSKFFQPLILFLLVYFL